MSLEALSKEEAYTDCLHSILSLGVKDSLAPIFQKISQIDEDVKFREAILTEMDKTKVYPDSLSRIITFLKFIQTERLAINGLYEESIEKYNKINQLTSKRKSTDDEAKIKKTLTDFIIKIESFFEANDTHDEGIVRELNKYMAESNLFGSSGKEFLNLKVSSKSMSIIVPLMEKLILIFFDYKKYIGILQRLIKISNYIIEDAEKLAKI
ncbi:MAG: hypothetical protein L6Q54_00475 [Leptospiraceae bacterium]|nr:hypothetical protein [Leptospiraceae bacterium]MCK6379711.1 hypothetical protein [Leptospiraceae bacterium]NUM40515.1 hypothetical protein [Leptospiraceae bacterium]